MKVDSVPTPLFSKSSLQVLLIINLILIPSPQTLSAKNATALDKDLMSIGGFSIDQLMELAGLSVSQAGLYNPNSSDKLTQINALSVPHPPPK